MQHRSCCYGEQGTFCLASSQCPGVQGLTGNVRLMQTVSENWKDFSLTMCVEDDRFVVILLFINKRRSGSQKNNICSLRKHQLSEQAVFGFPVKVHRTQWQESLCLCIKHKLRVSEIPFRIACGWVGGDLGETGRAAEVRAVDHVRVPTAVLPLPYLWDRPFPPPWVTSNVPPSL